jgi:zinc transport system substrate-binding protein
MLNQKQNKIYKSFKVFIVFVLFFAGLPGFYAVYAEEKPGVFVGILPQKYFVDQLAPDMVETNVMVSPGMSPHTYTPTPRQMAKLTRSKFFFTLGLPFEKTIVKKMQAVCPDVEVIPCNNGIKYRRIESADLNEHNSGNHEDCDHATGNQDPHIWLDPLNAKVICQNKAYALKRILPEKAEMIDKRCQYLCKKLDAFHQKISNELKLFAGRTVLVFHPAFGYFTDRYNLNQHAIESEGKEPSPRQMAKIIRQCKAEKIKTVLVQQQFSGRAAEAIANAIGGAVVVVDPLQFDYFDGLEKISTAIRESMEK